MGKREGVTYEEYLAIRKELSKGLRIKELSLKHGFSQELIKLIVTAEAYDFEIFANFIKKEKKVEKYNRVQKEAEKSMLKGKKAKERPLISERDKRILELRRSGKTLEEIGQDVGVTRERVRQIVSKLAPKEVFPTPKKVRDAEKNSSRKEISREISIRWSNYKHFTIEDLAKEFSLTTSEILGLLNRVQITYLKANKKSHVPQIWTSDECLRVLREAATFAFPLTILEYRKLVDSNTIEGPTTAIFNARFGSWTAACAAAGVETGSALREYDSSWSDAEILLEVRRFMWETREVGWSPENYEKWRQSQDAAIPSFALIRMRLGAWSQVRVMALDFETNEYDMTIFEVLNDL